MRWWRIWACSWIPRTDLLHDRRRITIKRFLCLLICFVFTVQGCGYAADDLTAPGPDKDIDSSSSSAQEADEERRETIQRPEIGAEVIIDPAYNFDPNEMYPWDFGGHFSEQSYVTDVSTYKIGEGTDAENEVTVLTGEAEGPSVYVVAGVHGDEQAAWETGNQLKKIKLKAGKLYVLSPANRWGASKEPRSRYVTEKYDLNRSFPGDPNGDPAQRVADTIFRDIERLNPVFLFDLHEARKNSENYDFLGSSLIYTDLAGMEDLYLGLLAATATGEVGSEQFNFFAPGPIGSINNTVSTQLKIPVITVETYRGYPLERRIGDQLDIVEYVLDYYGMI